MTRGRGGIPVEPDALYQEYAKMLYHFIYLKCGDKALAEDIVQTTFLKAITRIDSFKGESIISTWLCEIARNEYLNYCRKNKRCLSYAEYMEKNKGHSLKADEDIHNSILEKMIINEQADVVKKVVDTMKEPYKGVYMLRVYGECTFGEITEMFQRNDI